MEKNREPFEFFSETFFTNRTFLKNFYQEIT